MGMRLTVLGSSASMPAAGDACSGYLVEAPGWRVLLDCGSGVLGKLQQYAAPATLDAIVISHMHPDHYIDLVPLRYGLRYGEAGVRPVPVFLPPGGVERLVAVGCALSQTQPFFDGALALAEYEPGRHIPIACAGADAPAITPVEVAHGIRSFALRVEAGGRRLVHSSDTVDGAQIRAAAAGAELLLAEATLGGGAPAHHEPRTHLSAEDAGAIAADAGVRRLLLTHFWRTADRERARREAAWRFTGEVLAARPGLQVQIG